MRKIVFGFVCAAFFLGGLAVGANPVPAKITVGKKTSNGYIVSRKDNLITFRITGMGGDVSYPVDAIREVEFPVKVDQKLVGDMIQNRLYEQLAATLETALEPFAEYSDLPSNIARYQGVLMELYYKAGDYAKSIAYSAKLLSDARDKELQHKATIYQALALMGANRLEDAEALFAEQGWTEEISGDETAEALYMTARLQFMKKEYGKAAETAAHIIAFHSQNADWMRPAEVLCAEIYMEMARAYDNPDFLDSADEVVREITLLYKGTEEAEQAQSLTFKIDAIRIEMDAERKDG